MLTLFLPVLSGLHIAVLLTFGNGGVRIQGLLKGGTRSLTRKHIKPAVYTPTISWVGQDLLDVRPASRNWALNITAAPLGKLSSLLRSEG